jgi:REP element-mobilizing transposase RayT
MSATRHGFPEIVRGFKTFASRRINLIRRTSGQPVWQRNYYEHVIRSEGELNLIRQYIQGNPEKWGEDRYNPDKIRSP